MSKLPRLKEDKYRGQWVALNPKTKTVVGSGKSIKAAEKAAARKGVLKPILHGVPKSDA